MVEKSPGDIPSSALPRPYSGTFLLGLALLIAPLGVALTPSGSDQGAELVEEPPASSFSPWTQTTKLDPSPSPADRGFGEAVDLDGGTAVVGTRGTDAVHVFEEDGDGWTRTDRVTGAPSFGESAVVDGETLAVGAPDSAQVEVFERDQGDGWNREAILTGGDGFGYSISLNDRTMVVGAPYSDTAQVFQKTEDDQEWNLEAEFSVLEATCLGGAVAVDGGYVAVSDLCASDSVYLFQERDDGWTRQAKLTVDDAPVFGKAIALDADAGVLAAGAPKTPAVHVFQRGGDVWSHVVELRPQDEWPDDSVQDGFGRALDLDGSHLAVGAADQDRSPGLLGSPAETELPVFAVSGHDTERAPGAVYVYEKAGTSWDQVAKIASPDGLDEDAVGQAVALDDQRILAGAPGHDSGLDNHVFQRDSGAAFVLQPMSVGGQEGGSA